MLELVNIYIDKRLWLFELLVREGHGTK